MKIEDIDKNFKAKDIDNINIVYFDALQKPFLLEGFPWHCQGKVLNRIPESLTTNNVNDGVLTLAQHTAGGAIRFKTNSQYIALRAKLFMHFGMPHMPQTGSMGFDILRGKSYHRFHFETIKPENNLNLVEQTIVTNSNDLQEWQLSLPLYSGIESIEIGLTKDALIELPPPRKVKASILFYGSSITQGGCASRPSNTYTSLLCQSLDAAQINLGFSGSAFGELAIAEAIAKLSLSAFVYDYDHNAPSVKHLIETHEPFFITIRKQQPNLPVIMLSKCDFWDYKQTTENNKRREVVYSTFERAKKNGDKNVYFVGGETLFGSMNRTVCTVDTCHPNDLGFYRMFENILPVLQQSLS